MYIRRKLRARERRQIYDKMQGHCAYCGCELDFKKFQVDHIQPLCNGGLDAYCNMYPACRSCNHRKGTSNLESFREQIEKFPAVLARDSVTYRNAVRFGLVTPTPKPVKFYFERRDKDA